MANTKQGEMELPTSTELESPQTSLGSGPPELPYSLWNKKKAIALNWTLIIVDSCIFAVVLFYPLWFGTSLSPSTIFTIITSVVGVVSLLQFFWRLRLLLKKDPFRRPLGSKRGSLDAFQVVYVICVILVTLELVLGTVPTQPLIRLCSMPPPSVMFIAATIDLTFTLLHIMEFKTPFQISSVAKGERFRPGIYFVTEDVVGVDGNGGRPYRKALDVRYHSSPMFRRMLVRLSLFWSLSALIAAAGMTAVIFTVEQTVAFGVGWVGPFIWGAFCTVTTIKWVQRSLREEKKTWGSLGSQLSGST